MSRGARPAQPAGCHIDPVSALDGAALMRRDQRAYSRFAPGDAPLLRFYTWPEAIVSLGRFQTPSADFSQGIAKLGLATVQRPTGGAAILHGGDLTFSLVAAAELMPGNLLAGHALICRALAQGLALLGIEADSGRMPVQRGLPGCFAQATPADLCCGGRKLVGTAQVRRRQALLVQGTLYLRADYDRLQALFGPQASEIADLAGLLPEPPPAAVVAQALQTGFAQVLGLDFGSG